MIYCTWSGVDWTCLKQWMIQKQKLFTFTWLFTAAVAAATFPLFLTSIWCDMWRMTTVFKKCCTHFVDFDFIQVRAIIILLKGRQQKISKVDNFEANDGDGYVSKSFLFWFTDEIYNTWLALLYQYKRNFYILFWNTWLA